MITLSTHLLLIVFLAITGLMVLLGFAQVSVVIRRASSPTLAAVSTGLFLGGLIVLGWVAAHFLTQADWSATTTINISHLFFGSPSS